MKQITFSFIQNEFFTVEDPYNDAVYLLYAINNFLKLDSFACDNNINSWFRDATKSPSLHLSCIAIPKFSNNSTDWENFRHTFESLVD